MSKNLHNKGRKCPLCTYESRKNHPPFGEILAYCINESVNSFIAFSCPMCGILFRDNYRYLTNKTR